MLESSWTQIVTFHILFHTQYQIRVCKIQITIVRVLSDILFLSDAPNVHFYHDNYGLGKVVFITTELSLRQINVIFNERSENVNLHDVGGAI